MTNLKTGQPHQHPYPNRGSKLGLFSNHPSYIHKHPGGSAKLQNLTQVYRDEINNNNNTITTTTDDEDEEDGSSSHFIIFDPVSLQNRLSKAELDQSLRQAFDEDQDFADLEKMETYLKFPESVPSIEDLPSKSAETLIRLAQDLATYTLSDAAWNNSEGVREYRARNLRLVLSTARLVDCLETAEEAYRDGATHYDILGSFTESFQRYKSRVSSIKIQ